MSSVDKIKWAMSLRDPQYEALKCFDNISSRIEYKTASNQKLRKLHQKIARSLTRLL